MQRYTECCKISRIVRKQQQSTGARNCCNCNICKACCPPFRLAEIGETTRNSCRTYVKRQYSVAIQVQQGL